MANASVPSTGHQIMASGNKLLTATSKIKHKMMDNLFSAAVPTNNDTFCIVLR